MRLNTVGFVLKDGPISRLEDAIRLLAAGTFVCETELIRHILTRLSQWATYSDEARNGEQLSIRESEVLTLVTRGSSNKQIAHELFLSEGTVKAHVSHIMNKLSVDRRTDLVRHALTKGLVPMTAALFEFGENGDNGAAENGGGSDGTGYQAGENGSGGNGNSHQAQDSSSAAYGERAPAA